MYGQLIPVGGGDVIPLFESNLLVGRRESCDIVLRFSNVSAHHCELHFKDGYWFVQDLKSRNGIKVNGIRVMDRILEPGDILSVAKHKYEVQYSPTKLGATEPPSIETVGEEILRKSLLKRAGLDRRPSDPQPTEDTGFRLKKVRKPPETESQSGE